MKNIPYNGGTLGVAGFERGVGPDVTPANVTQTNMMLGYVNKASVSLGSIAPRAGFNVDNPKIPKISMAQILGNRMQTQHSSGRGGVHEVGFQMEADVQLAILFSQAKIKLTYQQRMKWEKSYGAIGIDQILARVAAELVLNEDDAEMLTAVWATGIWTTQYLFSGGTAKWNTASADIVAQVGTARDAVGNACGNEPNHLVLPQKVATACMSNPRLLRAMKGGRGSDSTNQAPTYDDLRQVLKVEKLTVINRRRNTAANLLTSAASFDYVASDGVLFFVDDGGGPMTASAFIRAHQENAVDGAEGVAIVSGTNTEDDYDWWKIQKKASIQKLDANAAAWWDDVL